MAGETVSPDGGAPADAGAVAAVPAEAAIVAAEAPAEAAVEAPAPSAVEGADEAAPAAEPEAPAAEAEPVAPAEGEAPPAEAAPAEPVEPVAPVYETFTLPDGFQAAPEQIEAFTGVLGKYGLTQEAGQELMDLHATSLKAMGEQLQQHQMDVFAETRRGWVQDFDKSAGNRRDTILNDAKWAITELVPDEKARTALWSVLAFTGAGDNKAVIGAFASAAKRLRERAAPPPPVPPRGKPQSAPDRRYGAKT